MVNIWSLFVHSIAAGCPLCHAPTDGLCSACATSLPHNRHACPRCALPLPATAPAATPCGACLRDPPAVDSITAALRYEAPVDELVAGLKYHQRLALAAPLAQLLGDVVSDRAQPRPQLLLPVPMHATGLRERGFNQAAELTRLLARRLAIPWSAGQLLRVRHGVHQRGLNRAERRRNLRGSFACRGPLPAHVAIIDDVVTTTATVSEIGRTLRRFGVDRIDVWAVARTPRDRMGH